MTWLEEKGGMEILGKTCHSSREQTDTISPHPGSTDKRQTGKGSGKGVSNLFPELRQSITPALPVTGHWSEWMCWVFLFPPESTASYFNAADYWKAHVLVVAPLWQSMSFNSHLYRFAADFSSEKDPHLVVMKASSGVWSSCIDLWGNQVQSGSDLSLFKMTSTPL